MASLYSVPSNSPMRSKRIALVYKRRRISAGCFVLPELEREGEGSRFLAYADERHIVYEKNLARTFRERQAMKRRHNNPYIAALLIAVAQAHDNRTNTPHITASVLFTPNTVDPTITQRLEHVHLYSARIPCRLLNYLRRPVPILPVYDPISVSCVSIPVEPLESLWERIFLVMPGEGRDRTPETGEE